MSRLTQSAFLGLALCASLFALPASAQMAAGKGKFVGNVIAGYVPADFGNYWNQVTPENATKWGSAEATRNVMNWNQADAAYNYARSKGFPFKIHTLVWGSQEPAWVKNLDRTSQLVEVEQWMRLSCERYPDAWGVDVVNEPLHAVPSFKEALGGDGATGWDWVITSFRMARQYCPRAKLLLNEYATEAESAKRAKIKTIAGLLKSRGLIDGIGLQAHYFNLDYMSASQLKVALDDYATTGIDIYISELDLKGDGSDAGQLAKYQALFPVMWDHASIKGITLWGYKVGETWSAGTGLLNQNGSERPALSWLKSYLGSRASVSSSSSTASSSTASSSASSSSVASSSAASASQSSSVAASSQSSSSAASSASPASGGVVASYSVNSDWGSGYCASVRVENKGSSQVVWQASLNVSGKISQLWNATWTQAGSTLSLFGSGWNKQLAPGAAITAIGFCATR